MLEADGLVEIAQRKEILAVLAEDGAAQIIGMGEFRFEEQGAGEVLDGQHRMVELLLRETAIIEGGGAQLAAHRIDPQCGRIIIDGAIMLACLLIGIAAIDQRIGELLGRQVPGLDRL